MKNKTFKEYITDALKNINETVAKQYGGAYITDRWGDLTNLDREEKTGDDIVREVFKNAGLQTGGQANGFDDSSSYTDA